jgi:hypothetical protein
MPDFPVPISERAERGVRWLEQHARGRYQGWCIDADGVFAVDISNLHEPGVRRFLGDSLEDALARAAVAVREEASGEIRLRGAAPARLVAVARRGEPAAFALARALEAMDA